MEDLYSFSSKRLPYIEFPDFILKKGGLQYFEQTETKKKKKNSFHLFEIQGNQSINEVSPHPCQNGYDKQGWK